MRLSEIMARITGVSIPIFGASWTFPEAQVTVARRVIDILAPRRVLYDPGEMQVPKYCVESVLCIKKHLTDEIKGLDEKAQLRKSIQRMQQACNDFLTKAQTRDNWPAFHPSFVEALDALRAVFGREIGIMAAMHKLDVPEELDPIIPVEIVVPKS